ncbi:MAG TPA: alpha/beta hydrolase domain-containing protein, partial [Polyangiaceae bacterium]|nr:alpha/beta hydrolase domain-containing protein [Polyangiaceae bacterium]
ASGQSQSAMMLTTYVNSVQATARVYDGFLLHSGFVEPASNNPPVPVFVVFTMNEGNGKLAEGPNFTKWQVAGATHNDANLMAKGTEVMGDLGNVNIECSKPVNDFPAWQAYNAAYDWLERWVSSGERPPSGTPFETAPGGGLRLDQHGNALGGVRLPDIEVPVATHSLANAPANPFDIVGNLACGLGGSVTRFTEQQLLDLYSTHERYVQEYTHAADEALAAGYLLRADYDAALEAAKKAPIPN